MESLASSHEVGLESFHYALIKQLDERHSVWGHKKDYIQMGIFEFFTAIDIQVFSLKMVFNF